MADFTFMFSRVKVTFPSLISNVLLIVFWWHYRLHLLCSCEFYNDICFYFLSQCSCLKKFCLLLYMCDVCMKVHAMAHYGHVIRRQLLEVCSILLLWVLEIKLRSLASLFISRNIFLSHKTFSSKKKCSLDFLSKTKSF